LPEEEEEDEWIRDEEVFNEQLMEVVE